MARITTLKINQSPFAIIDDLTVQQLIAAEHAREDAFNLLRFARAVEAAVINKFEFGDVPADVGLTVVQTIVRRSETIKWSDVGLTKEVYAADREVSAFIASAAWMNMVTESPSHDTIVAEARRRYLPQPPAPPSVKLSTGTWRKAETGWQRLVPFTAIAPNTEQWQYNLSQPDCDTAEDYNTIAEYLNDLEKGHI